MAVGQLLDSFSVVVFEFLGQDDLDFRQKVARLFTFRGGTVAFYPKLGSAGSTRWDLQRHGSLWRGQIDFGSQGGFGQSHRDFWDIP